MTSVEIIINTPDVRMTIFIISLKTPKCSNYTDFLEFCVISKKPVDCVGVLFKGIIYLIRSKSESTII